MEGETPAVVMREEEAMAVVELVEEATGMAAREEGRMAVGAAAMAEAMPEMVAGTTAESQARVAMEAEVTAAALMALVACLEAGVVSMPHTISRGRLCQLPRCCMHASCRHRHQSHAAHCSLGIPCRAPLHRPDCQTIHRWW